MTAHHYHSHTRPMLPSGLTLTLAVALALAISGSASSFASAKQITLRSPYADNGRLACRPKFACVGGIVTPATNSTTRRDVHALNVATVRIAVAGQTASASVVPTKGGEWRACLSRTVKASSSRRYDMIVTGVSRDGAVLETHTVRQMSFGHGLVLDGQSNMAFPLAASVLPGDVTLTNATQLVAEWERHGFYGITMMVTGTSATALSAVPRVTFPVIAKNWTRSDTPGFGAFLMSTAVGWLAVTSCIEHARLNGPTHCLQIAVPTTRLETHMSPDTYARSGMTVAKPFTTAGSELLQSVGALWNTKLVLQDWQMDAYHFRQGEANAHNPAEYAVLLSRFVDDLFTTFVDASPNPTSDADHDDDDRRGDGNGAGGDDHDHDDDDADDALSADALSASAGVKTVVTIYALPTYNGTRSWFIPPSQTLTAPANAPFNLTAEAQRVVDGRDNVCFVRTGHLGYFTLRDGGLHIPDTAMDAAIAAAECYQNVLLASAAAGADGGAVKPRASGSDNSNNNARGKPPRPQPLPLPNVVTGPKPLPVANVTAWNPTTGVVTISVAFDTALDPATGEPLDIAWTLVPRPAPSAPLPFAYSQFDGVQFSRGVPQEPVTIDTTGRTLTLTFVVERPAFGRPTTLTYNYMSDFARYLIANDPAAVAPHPHWRRAPIPADPFTVALINTAP